MTDYLEMLYRGEPLPPLTDRSQVLDILCQFLSGMYNENGMLKWFFRPRSQLNDKAPAELVLSNDPADWKKVINLAVGGWTEER